MVVKKQNLRSKYSATFRKEGETVEAYMDHKTDEAIVAKDPENSDSQI